ncbi:MULTISPECIES: SDR family NAD(P)-dependent oxidoreductase [Microbacterium]|uniref:3beta-hydroxysteroid 3-dehydrogenase n=2 Tax=Microbacterium ginsengisoli TaxID=400772 RepID=A0A0F0M2N8_9MICO|nr:MULTISPECIES: SDR family NAD(P)-dependent oxidoreductase [Microbacterium]MCK9913089.1 SDR family NAD(P)-dependent oxidoreductase [Microbacteriaceae bacterium K1510]KJL39559.1 3-oxoacyl-[acyl-carrier-protein] reductase FabG1 [Microbacterium ginsengisoli]KQS01123.1 dehydrogenase [Microbacterium sp. Leaf347]KQS05754.1 dehydrogenase [Microbacterium sp. Leaf351]MBN9199083.1 SDR family NAD(P)-dependent oxidoreductase [Microbacterium ginsengisoli]
MSARAAEWNPLHLPDLRGRSYLVTGANAGLGYFSCEQLVRGGAHVIMTGRNPHRLSAAKAAVLGRTADAPHRGTIETLLLDTSNLGSVRAAAATVRHRGRLHGLLLNAGMVHPPRHRQTTFDGNELVFATNALGHFALAGALLRTLAAARGRMVWLGSMSTSLGRIDPVDPQLASGYSGWRAYVQSKIATTALGLEADRRLRAERVPVASVIAHPGYSVSGRTAGIQGVNEPSRLGRFVDNLQSPLTQSKEHGAWPLVRALVDPDVVGGQFWGPARVTSGPPRLAAPAKVTQDPAVAERYWVTCENATRLRWPFEAARR